MLGCDVDSQGDTLHVTVPGFRPDLQREVDLVEEVGRIYGYDRIEASSSFRGPLENAVVSDFEVQQGFRQRITAAGVDEVVTSTIVDGGWTSLGIGCRLLRYWPIRRRPATCCGLP